MKLHLLVLAGLIAFGGVMVGCGPGDETEMTEGQRQTQDGLDTMSDGMSDTLDGMGQRMEDSTAHGRVWAAIVGHTDIASSGIDIHVDGNELHLHGHVPTEAQKALAEQVARENVDEGMVVVNMLEIQPEDD